MDVKDAVVVVTGAGSGIGAALARRFAGEGAAAVVVSDRDGTAAHAVAETIGATADTTDVTDPAAVAELVARTESAHGRVDLFCSNAGIATGVGIEAGDDGGDEAWRLAYDVHVMAHVYAARAVLPGMLERGRGYLLNTVSAAGLLIAPGDAPYSATKHAAVGLAQWLSVEYGDRGIGVSVLCPQGVSTPLLMEPLAADHPSARAVAAAGAIITPEQVADSVVSGLAAETFLILPHPEVATYWAHLAADPDRWLAGVRRMVAATT
ncbi:MAG TPA: SDR family oxidoreductase [Jatrophihabitantaceae bacterium]|jgi:NAD(P)-dependent dehydrogenase (short-subunit alcohol dehydrogenase family)